jgi:ABC-type transporter Mla subunit MlaD
MKKERNALKAGIFMIVCLGLLIGGVLMIAGSSTFFEKRQIRTVVFSLEDNVGGLRVGDEVRIGGFKVGSVRAIDVVGVNSEDEEPRVVVTFAMPEKYIVREGSRISVETTVTGSSALNIDYLGKGPEMPMAASLKGQPSWMSLIGKIVPEAQGLLSDARTVTLPKINITIEQAGKTVAAFESAGTEATQLIKHVRTKIDPAVDKYHQVGDRASEMMVEIRDLFGDTKGDFRDTIANLSATTGALKEKLPVAMDRVNDVLARVQDNIGVAAEALADVRKTAENAKEITGSARSIITSNRTRIDNMIASLKTTGDNLKAASAEIRRSPWRLLYKPGPGEVANLNLFDSARQFAEGANDLSDAATALRDALAAGQGDEQILPLVEKLEKTFSKFSEMESTLWERVRE